MTNSFYHDNLSRYEKNKVLFMLLIKCAGCKSRLWKYDKIGKGELLRCYKNRIKKTYTIKLEEQQVFCLCGQKVAIDKGNFLKMIRKGITYSGAKRTS